jgi:hypothetical protein
MSFFLQRESKTLKYAGFAAILLSLGLIGRVEAQSGRRGPKPSPSRTPVPTTPPSNDPEARLAPTLPSGALAQKVHLLIGRQTTKRHLQSEDTIFASFVNRLNAYPNVTGSSIGDLKRQEAVIRAKSEAESFVVLLSFEIDSFQNGTIILNSPDLQIEYQILAPVTGKKLTKGKIYFQSIGGGRMRKSEWPGGTPIKITAEAAGIEAADHVHDWLRLDEVRKRRHSSNN